MPSMDPFRTPSAGGWRFTAMLGAVAVVLSAGILSWIMVTVADMKSSVPSRSIDLARYYAPQSTQPQERIAERPSPAEARRPTQLGGLPGIASWVDDMHALGTSPFGRQAFLGPSPLEFRDTPAATPPAWQPETTAQAATQSPVRTALTETAPASTAPTDRPASVTPADNAAVAEAPPAATPTPPANVAAVETAPVEQGLPPPMVHSRRLALAHEPEVRTFRVVPTHPHKPAAVAAGRPTYTEKIVEQGDSGELKFHYRRRACTPGHMVDVCYMPAENRRSIVVQRY
jgi:hypothetical protein